MLPLPPPPLLGEVLRVVARRYRLPAIPAASDPARRERPAAALALAIEQARAALAQGEEPDATLKRAFIESLARLIQEAMRAEYGDPVFQAMVLRHQAPQVREFASLSAHTDQDRRLIRATVNAIAHPAKQQRFDPGQHREMLAQLQASASAASWSELADTARQLLRMPEVLNEPLVERALKRLLDGHALERLQRLAALGPDELVRQYQSLWDRNGPPSGSPAATARGRATQQRGEAVEASAAEALEALARRLDTTEGAPGRYRVVTSMRVPASIPGNADRAKSEWDAVLLRQTASVDARQAWDVCLLVEAKASVDAATTDFPRLLRGLRLLAHAKEDAIYPFATQQGEVPLHGASLKTLTVDPDGAAGSVLYCCDGPAEAAPRLLSSASRMQLLSTEASLEFASNLASNQPADPGDLAPVWRQLLESPQWHAVLDQYASLRRTRNLMVHVADLSAAIRSS